MLLMYGTYSKTARAVLEYNRIYSLNVIPILKQPVLKNPKMDFDLVCQNVHNT